MEGWAKSRRPCPYQLLGIRHGVLCRQIMNGKEKQAHVNSRQQREKKHDAMRRMRPGNCRPRSPIGVGPWRSPDFRPFSFLS